MRRASSSDFASPRQASRAASEAAPSPSPSPRGRRGAPEHIPSHITLSNANADLKKSIGQLRAERDGAFGERDAVLRQLKVLKQRAREHLAALHAEKQMLEEQAAAATRRLREHEEAHAALHAKLKAAEERLAAMAASFKAAEEIQTRVAAEREVEHAALLDERAGRRAAEEGRRRSEEAAAALRDERGRLVAKCEIYEERDAELRAKAERTDEEVRMLRTKLQAVEEAEKAGGALARREREELEASRDRLARFAEMEEARGRAHQELAAAKAERRILEEGSRRVEESLRADKDALTRRCDALDARTAELMSARDAAAAEKLEALSAQATAQAATSAAASELRVAEERLARAEAAAEALREAKGELGARAAAAEEHGAQLAARLAAADERYGVLRKEHEAVQAALADGAAARAAAEEGARRSKEFAAGMRDERGRLVAKCEIYEERDAELRAKAARLEAEMRPTTDRMAAVQAEHDALLASSHRDKAEITKYRAQLTHFAEMEEGRSAAQRELAACRAERTLLEESARRGEADHRADKDSLLRKIDALLGRQAELQAERDAAAAGQREAQVALARAEADGRVLRELAGQAGDRVEAQKDREGALLAAQALAGDYARQLAALSELQAAHRTADARARGTPLPRGGGGDVLLDSGEPADDGAVDWAAFAAATDYQLGSPGVYPSYSSPALFTR